MHRQGTVVVVLLTVSLLAASCKKTVEGESKSWERNTQKVQELTALYPGFGTALKEQLQTAQAAMDAAKAITDQEQSAKKMAEANALLGSGFVNTLSQLDDRVRRLREKLVTASTTARSGGELLGARAVIDDAQRILRNVDVTLRVGAPSTIAATVVLRRIDGDVTSAMANVDRVIDSARQRAQAKGKKGAPTAGGGGAAGGGGKAAPAVAAKWKCAYCSKEHDDTIKKCNNCGAAR